jgi:hypothetical protein
MTTWVTARGIALAVGVLTPAVWLLWAEHLDAGWPTVLASAGLWWLAALQATWRVWLPAAVTLLALWLALPPRPPPRWDAQEPPEAPPPPGTGPGEAERAVSAGEADAARRGVAELLAFARTPEGFAALEAEREAARAAPIGPREPEPTVSGGGEPDRAGAAIAPDDEEADAEDDAEGDGDDEAGGAAEDGDETPAGQDPPRDPPRAVGPASGPAPPRTVWEAFALLDQESEEDEGDDDAA